jgi:2,4-dienoyl-CoA reductase-like NADH-dependent reductase (Old Yellow Enzyme family)
MTSAPRFPTLFSPFRLREVELRNRIVSAAHGTTMSVAGLPTEATAAYHAACARGGVGLIVLEAAAVHASATYNSRFLSCCTDAAVPGFRRIADAVHAHGATVFGQLYHPGAPMRGQVAGLKLVPVGPSHVKTETNRVPARMMTLDEVREVVVACGDAASRMMAGAVRIQRWSPITASCRLTRRRPDRTSGRDYGLVSMLTRSRSLIRVL